MSAAEPPIRDAATVIAYRGGSRPEILMGQRGAKAVFMPDKFVFPGGALSDEDREISLAGLPEAPCMARLSEEARDVPPSAVLAAAIRELWEETGLILGRPGPWDGARPAPWQAFAARGYQPDATGVRFVFRAVTPPGRPRRFDARFLLVPANRLIGEIGGDGELSNLQWIPLDAVRRFNLPFITQVVLAEIAGLFETEKPPEGVPFFRGRNEEILFDTLTGRRTADAP